MVKVSSSLGSDDSVVRSVVAFFDADVPVSVICVRGHADIQTSAGVAIMGLWVVRDQILSALEK